MRPPPLEVVAAVIVRDGKILICQRPAGRKHALKWEFPGGKLEPGETPQEGLIRELREELAIEAQIGEQLDRYLYRYPTADRDTLLWFFRVTEFAGEPQNLEFAEIRWEAAQALPDYDFLEGDTEFVTRFSQSAG